MWVCTCCHELINFCLDLFSWKRKEREREAYFSMLDLVHFAPPFAHTKTLLWSNYTLLRRQSNTHIKSLLFDKRSPRENVLLPKETRGGKLPFLFIQSFFRWITGRFANQRTLYLHGRPDDSTDDVALILDSCISVVQLKPKRSAAAAAQAKKLLTQWKNATFTFPFTLT